MNPAVEVDEYVIEYARRSAQVTIDTAERCGDQIRAAVSIIADAFSSSHKLLLCGNGGSAADCQHVAAEFVSLLRRDRPRRALPAIALTTDTSFLTARANDFSFDEVFSRQVEALGQEGDVLVGISTSGNSRNVCEAVRTARARGLRTVVLVGCGGGTLADMADCAIVVPSDSTQHIQEAMLAVEHMLCELTEHELFGR